MAFLPIELFDIVIDILKNDSQALNALALTHPSLTPRAQQHIFAHIALSGEQDDTDNADSILVALSHPKHAHLLPYVRALTLINLVHRRVPAINTEYVPNLLIPVFIDAVAPRLSSLVLRGFAPGWDHDASTPLRTAIVRLLASPSLTHLDLDGVNKFPIALLNSSSALTRFRFATQYPSHVPVPNTVPQGTSPIYLDTLDVSLWGENGPLAFIDWLLGDSPTSRLSVARLRNLSINGAYTRQVALSFWRLLDACRSTLHQLSFGPDTFSHDNHNTLDHLHVLRTLQLKTVLTYHEITLNLNPTPFDFLLYLLDNLPSPSTLQQLDILVRYTWWGDGARYYEGMDMTPWDTLASFLLAEIQKGKFAKLECISIGVTTVPANPTVVTPQDIFPMIRQRFAPVLRSSAISIEFYDFM